MSARLLIAVAWLAIATAASGELRSRDDPVRTNISESRLDNATVNAGLDPSDERIVAFVSWLKGKGITLQYSKKTRYWSVTHPKTSDEYDVTFSIRTFPSWASEQQMRFAIGTINLAYMLNGPAHLAMSFGGLSGTHPHAKLPKSLDDELPSLDGVPIRKAVQRFFMEYKIN